ncbi:hypothetical protein [Azospirillum sp. sgz301742]
MKTMTNAALSRRSLLAGSALVAAGVPAVGAFGAGVELMDAAGLAALNPHPDAELLGLCQRWLELDRERGPAYDHAAERQTDLRQAGWSDDDFDHDPEYVARWAEYDRIDAMADTLDREIRALPARPLAGILAKLECWVVDSDPGPEDNTDHGFAVSALRDARRLGGPAVSASAVHQLAEVRHG